jgi:oxygen-independent coproporphyrinogen-3 oxidase
MFDGLGTEWSHDPALVAKLPTNSEACTNWLALREFLLKSGYRQTTLTNFERREVYGTENRFLYEEAVLSPEKYDWLGFGPSAISLFTDKNLDRALKLMNPESSTDYMAGLDSGKTSWDRFFSYSARDLKTLYLTRKIARLAINRGDYARLFGTDPLTDFALEFPVLMESGFMDADNGTIVLSPLGMFYADTCAGLLAWRQLKYLGFQRIVAGFTPQPETLFYGNRIYDASYHRMG